MIIETIRATTRIITITDRIVAVTITGTRPCWPEESERSDVWLRTKGMWTNGSCFFFTDYNRLWCCQSTFSDEGVDIIQSVRYIQDHIECHCVSHSSWQTINHCFIPECCLSIEQFNWYTHSLAHSFTHVGRGDAWVWYFVTLLLSNNTIHFAVN